VKRRILGVVLLAVVAAELFLIVWYVPPNA
jgi:hypothetical protein